MAIRVSTQSVYSRVLSGIRMNQLATVRAQEQLSSGRRILRPSDDPTGASRALSLSRRINDVNRFGEAINAGLVVVDTGTSGLQDASTLLSEARSLLVQAMNGTLTQDDRESIATEFDLLRTQMIEIGNLRAGDRYVFGGTDTTNPAWREVQMGSLSRVVYDGNDVEQLVRMGTATDIGINLPGSELFGKSESSGLTFAGLTGLSRGITANEGSGYEYSVLRHDSTDAGTLGTVGISLANGGAQDTLLGDNSITIDPVAGTIQLGSGPAVAFPSTGTPEAANFVIENELGGQLHLDMSTYDGTAFTGMVRGEGSISLDGTSFVSIDFTETDLQLENPNTGSVIHVNTTAVKRAGNELTTFSGAVNIFDALQGIADDLRNSDGLDQAEIVDRLNVRLDELDRNQDNVLVGLGVLGSKSQRLNQAFDRHQSVEVQLQSILSTTQDADFAEVALDLAMADYTLQTAQASGARLIQSSLLNFLG